MPNRSRTASTLALSLAAIAFAGAGCSSQAAPAEPASTVRPAATAAPAAGQATFPALPALPAEVTAGQAAALREQGAFVLDVREPSEWLEGHVPGATLVPLEQLPGRVGEVPRDRPVVVICRSGKLSAVGRDFLLGVGFPSVTSVSGGIRAWEAAGLPVRAGP